MLSNLYGSALPARIQIERQILRKSVPFSALLFLLCLHLVGEELHVPWRWTNCYSSLAAGHCRHGVSSTHVQARLLKRRCAS